MYTTGWGRRRRAIVPSVPTPLTVASVAGKADVLYVPPASATLTVGVSRLPMSSLIAMIVTGSVLAGLVFVMVYAYSTDCVPALPSGTLGTFVAAVAEGDIVDTTAPEKWPATGGWVASLAGAVASQLWLAQ